MSTTILTFSDVVSHSDTMFQFGYQSGTTFRNEDILRMYSVFTNGNAELHNVKSILPKCLYDIEDAYILVIRNYLSDDCTQLNTLFNSPESVSDEGLITGVEWDNYRIQKGKVVQNLLSKSLLFMNLNSDYKWPFNFDYNYGTIYNILRIPILSKINTIFEQTMYGPLMCEANFYNDRNQCYTPMRKESHRCKMIKVCVGESTMIHNSWYKQTTKVSDTYSIQLNNGDICIFSENAIGFKKDKPTCLLVKHSIGTNNECLK